MRTGTSPTVPSWTSRGRTAAMRRSRLATARPRISSGGTPQSAAISGLIVMNAGPMSTPNPTLSPGGTTTRSCSGIDSWYGRTRWKSGTTSGAIDSQVSSWGIVSSAARTSSRLALTTLGPFGGPSKTCAVQRPRVLAAFASLLAFPLVPAHARTMTRRPCLPVNRRFAAAHQPRRAAASGTAATGSGRRRS